MPVVQHMGRKEKTTGDSGELRESCIYMPSNREKQPMPLIIGVLAETAEGERRFSVVPDVVKKYQGLGATVVLQKCAGVPAHFADDAFAEVTFADTAAEICAQADVVFCVQPPPAEIIDTMKT